MKKIRVAFFGSSTFSIQTLRYLIEDNDISVECVITMPPAEKNRGKKLSNNIVHLFSKQNGISEDNILTPNTLKNNAELLKILRSKQLDFIVVVAYGKIITKDIIDLPKFEILNLHPSALPKYRGAAPIERAIENGDGEIGICIMRINTGLDTGDVAMRERYEISEQEHASDIIPEIADIGGKMMIESIKNIYIKNSVVDNNGDTRENTKESNKYKKSGKITFEKQDDDGMTYAPKIEKHELFIDVNDDKLTAEKVYNKIRAFNAYSGCYIVYNNRRIKILRAKLERKKDTTINSSNDNKLFAQLVLNKHEMYFSFNDGIVVPEVLQKEGKNPIKLKDFLNGVN